MTAETVTIVVVTGRGIPGDEATVASAAASLTAAFGDGAGLLVLGEKSNLEGCVLAGLDGTTPEQVLESARQGRLGWLYLVGQDPAGVWPRDLPARDAIEKAEFVVDGGLREFHGVLDPPGEAVQDGAIIRRLAGRMGVELPDNAEVEARARGLATQDGAHEVHLVEMPAPTEVELPEGFHLDPSPQLFHSGSTTRHSALLEELSPNVAVRISPRDAGRLGFAAGQAVRLVADGREVLLRARIDRRVPEGVVEAPWNSRNDGASRLIRKDGELVAVELGRS